MNTPGKPDPVPAGEPNSPDDPSCEQLASLAAALYPSCVEGEGTSRARVAADAALEVWQESNNALVAMRREREAGAIRKDKARLQGIKLTDRFMMREGARLGDPEVGTPMKRASVFLRRVWSDEKGETNQQNIARLKHYFLQCVMNGYELEAGADPKDTAERLWNGMDDVAADGDLRWLPEVVNAMRKCFEPPQRPPKGKKSPAKGTKTKTEKAPAAKKGATGKKD